jgi:hypothetical protein
MVNVCVLKITNPQTSSASNVGGTINMGFASFNKINQLSEIHGDWSTNPTYGVIRDPDFQDSFCTPRIIEAL